MSTITWLHLSDLHFRAEEQHTWDENVVLKALLKDIRAHIEEDNLYPDFIVVTGDIAFSGKPAEYKLAREFFDELLRTTGLPKDRLFLVPGNHDVDRRLITRGAQAIGDSLKDRKGTNAALCTPEDRRLLFAGLTSHMTFVKDYLPHLTLQDEGLFFVHSLDLQSQRIALLGLNSAWVSASDEDEAKKLLLGERQARAALDKAEDEQATLKIVLLHHPFDRLRDFDRSVVEPVLCKDCSFVLHGHLHRGGISSLRSPDAEAMIIAAGACYESRDFPNTYNWVQLNFAEGCGRVILRRYSDAGGGFWAPDTLTYQNVPDGKYTFSLPPVPASPPPKEGSSGRPREEQPSDKPPQSNPIDPEPRKSPLPEKPVLRRCRALFWGILLLFLTVLAGVILASLAPNPEPKVALLSSHGRYVTALGEDDDWQLKQEPTLGECGWFTRHNLDNEKVALKTCWGRYVTAPKIGSTRWEDWMLRQEPGLSDCGQFILHDLGRDEVAFETCAGGFFTAGDDTWSGTLAWTVIAQTHNIESWERFTVLPEP